MTNRLRTITTCLLAWLAIGAWAEDYVKATFVGSADAAQWKMPVKLVNTGSYVAFQMDIDLPDSFDVKSVSPNAERLASFVLDYNVVDEQNNIVRIVGYNMDNSAIQGASGDSIMTFRLLNTRKVLQDDATDSLTATLTDIQFVNSNDLSWAYLPGIVETDDNVESYFIDGGDAVQWLMPVKLTNAGSYVAYQMDIDLPSGVTVESVIPNSDRLAAGEIIDYNVVDADRNIVRLLAYSMSNDKIFGNSGDSIMTLKLKASEAMTRAEMNETSLSDIQFVRAQDLSWVYLTWEHEVEYDPADVNEDGVVDIADVASVLGVMYNTENYAKADVNGDGEVDIADVTTVLDVMFKVK